MPTKTPDYILLDHTADLGIRIYGTDLTDLFENACNSLIDLFLNIKSPRNSTPFQITIESEDLEDLMVRWLGEILYLFDGDNTVVISNKISKLSQNHLMATLETVTFDPLIHEITREIKAVTYHNIQVIEKKGTWEAAIIFDL